MNNIEIISKEECFSCRSCEQTCPKSCIKMLENESKIFENLKEKIFFGNFFYH